MPELNKTGGVDLLTLSAVMGECRNWFIRATHTGDFTISGGVLTDAESHLLPGQYYRILGSVFNDGVHRYGDDGDALTDEAFSGRVDALAPPPEFLRLATTIADWREKYGEAAASPYSSESENFANLYSRSFTKASGVTQDGASGGWQAAHRAELARWRKL